MDQDEVDEGDDARDDRCEGRYFVHHHHHSFVRSFNHSFIAFIYLFDGKGYAQVCAAAWNSRLLSYTTSRLTVGTVRARKP